MTAPTDTAPPPPVDVTEAREAATDLVATRDLDLSLRSGQDSLTPTQRAALAAVCNFDLDEPGAMPHLDAFLHLCVSRDLDPFAKEAHLIARGDPAKNNRTYSMQVGIDGFRKMARRTGLFRSRVGSFWTGGEDDDDAWTTVEVPGVGVVRRRVWVDQWPLTRGYPGAARTVVEHYDERGEITYTDGVAPWQMYAPLIEKKVWTGPNSARRQEVVRDENGAPVMVLMGMWEKGYDFMLAKCSEALALRAMAPGHLSGIYTHEEMHQADRDNAAAAAVEAAAERARAAQEYRSRALTTVPGKVVQPPSQGQDATSRPMTADDAAPDVTAVAPAAEATEGREGWAQEYRAQQAVLGTTAEKITGRWLRSRDVETVDALPEDALAALVRTLRPTAARRVAARGGPEDKGTAAWYQQHAEDPVPLAFTG